MALDLLVDGDPDAAVARLQPLAARNDGDALLYLGWAQLAAGRWDDAAKAFDGAIKAAPQRPVSARYGLARAQLGKGDRTAARATFLEVIAAEPEHVGALVGETEAMPTSDFVQREAALLAILQRKGLENADPRVVARAWTLAGDDARRAGRLDTARERYRKALGLNPGSVEAMVSSAALELRDGKLDAAAELAEKALSLAPSDVQANLANAELDIRAQPPHRRRPAIWPRCAPAPRRWPAPSWAASTSSTACASMPTARTTPRSAALEQASKVLGPDEVEPAIATATLLARMAKTARAKKDEPRAKALEAQAKERLGVLSAAAEQDPALAVTLGVAYLAAGSAAEGETWLRKAIAKRPADVEANFQLAEALRRQGKQDEALATLVKAFELDPTRIDLGIELARGFEAAGQDAEASSLYKRLVDGATVSLDVRIRAGRFFARIRDFDAARKQGEKILEDEPANPAGLFLRAEGLLADGHADDARRLYQQAADVDADPQFLDGLGRACEQLAESTGDTARRDEALRAYMLASEKAPRMLNPLLGRGRLHMARREFAKALAAFEEALRVAPDDPSIPYGIGISYAELSDRPNAVEWLTQLDQGEAARRGLLPPRRHLLPDGQTRAGGAGPRPRHRARARGGAQHRRHRAVAHRRLLAARRRRAGARQRRRAEARLGAVPAARPQQQGPGRRGPSRADGPPLASDERAFNHDSGRAGHAYGARSAAPESSLRVHRDRSLTMSMLDGLRGRAERLAFAARVLRGTGFAGALRLGGVAPFARVARATRPGPHLAVMLHARMSPDKECLVDGARRWTWRELDQRHQPARARAGRARRAPARRSRVCSATTPST